MGPLNCFQGPELYTRGDLMYIRWILIMMIACVSCAKRGALNFSSEGPQRSGSPADAFACTAAGTPGSTEILKLTKYELINTLTDVFGATVISEVQIRIDAIPRDNLVKGFETIERSVSGSHIQAYFDMAETVARQSTSTTARMNSVAGSCFQDTSLADSCLTAFVNSMGLKLFRRPLLADEVTELKSFYTANSPTRRDGVQIVLSRMLQSPNFLYRLEDSGIQLTPGVLELTPYELASRLSYTLWGSLPDAALFADAANGKLTTEEGLSAQMTRLLASTKAKAHIKNFYSQWLSTNLEIANGFSTEFLEGISTTGLSEAMKAELSSFVEYIIWTKKGSIADLLTSSESFVTHPELAKVYKSSVWTAGTAPVNLPSGERSGITTRAAFLSSGDDETHPFRRGSKVLSRILCYDPPRPDSDKLPEGALDEPPMDHLASTRERFETKTSAPVCLSCHSKINPFSFALENYDGLGRFRTIERVRDTATHEVLSSIPIDSVVNYLFGNGETRTFGGGVEMSKEIASSGDADVCFVRQWYRFSRSKIDSVEDNCAMKPIYDALRAEGGSIIKVIETSVMDSTFRVRKLKL
jgi:hypothetical protein